MEQKEPASEKTRKPVQQRSFTFTWTAPEIDYLAECVSLSIQMRPVLLCAKTQHYVCPRCHTEVSRYFSKFCSECGQALDWEEADAWEDELFHSSNS